MWLFPGTCKSIYTGVTLILWQVSIICLKNGDFSLLEFSTDILKTVSQALTIKHFMQPFACHIWLCSASCHGDMGIMWCGQCVGTA
jgi:hypothetical protein